MIPTIKVINTATSHIVTCVRVCREKTQDLLLISFRYIQCRVII